MTWGIPLYFSFSEDVCAPWISHKHTAIQSTPTIPDTMSWSVCVFVSPRPVLSSPFFVKVLSTATVCCEWPITYFIVCSVCPCISWKCTVLLSPTNTTRCLCHNQHYNHDDYNSLLQFQRLQLNNKGWWYGYMCACCWRRVIVVDSTVCHVNYSVQTKQKKVYSTRRFCLYR
jgi:hypothetical protein